ncbi:MAG: hypothetical protein KJ950_03565 [Proteobacteria bacterium]|nr:hypothetical protein [Pseudomonadota bacterium]MBU1686397.1 hypothetical protein [Pseudomonadota bacterium]
MVDFKDQWNLEMALDVLESEAVDAKVWAEAVKWLLLYGPPHIKEILEEASGAALGQCFPDVAVKGYSESGQPYYDINDIALALGVPVEEALQTIAGFQFEEGVELLVEGDRVYKIQ